MAAKKGFGALIAAEVVDESSRETAPVLQSALVNRTAAISKMGGDIVYEQSQWIDPALCRPSPENARSYDDLNYENCAELIASIRAEGQQRFAAIVRKTDDQSVPYEIVAGLRRHWAVSWLRANNYPSFRYLINVQRLDDETAFRLSDLENRARTDITDLERAESYRKALSAHYGGDFERMAERLNLSSRNLRRYIYLAELEPVIVDALGGKRVAGLRHAAEIRSEMQKSTNHRTLLLEEAQTVADEQRRRAEAETPIVSAPDVVRRLVKATMRRPAAKPNLPHKPVTIESKTGKPMIDFVVGNRRTAAVLKILPRSEATIEETKEAVLKLIDELFSNR